MKTLFSLLQPLLLPLALVASLAGNLWQWRAAAVDAAVVEAGKTSARDLGIEAGRRQAAEEQAQRSQAAADMAQADSLWMLEQLSQLVERSRERVTIYRDRVQQLPAATCSPGAERMNTVNGLLQ